MLAREGGQRLTVAMPSELIALASTAREGQLAIAYSSVLAKQQSTSQVRNELGKVCVALLSKN